MSDGKILGEFLLKLSSDDVFLGRYVKDPKGIMTSFGLTPEAISALLAGDVARIRALLGRDRPSTTLVHVIPLPPETKRS
jgi:hypothetical protein